VVITEDAVYGLGSSQKYVQLALELAIDGAMVMHYAKAFGGVQFMTDRARALSKTGKLNPIARNK